MPQDPVLRRFTLPSIQFTWSLFTSLLSQSIYYFLLSREMVMENLVSVRTISFQFLCCLIQKQDKWCRDADRMLAPHWLHMRAQTWWGVCTSSLKFPSMSCPNCWPLLWNWGLLEDHCLNSMSRQETRPRRPKRRLSAGVGKTAARRGKSWSSSVRTWSMRLSFHTLLCCLPLREARDVMEETRHAFF